ncbi:CHAT domain-containing protein [Paenibacillus albiflavus]|nr:CHAT domain-containing protein [Paenibacillus albiflavus]
MPLIHYFIVLPNIDAASDVFSRITAVNRFDKRILKNIKFYEILFELPATVEEVIGDEYEYELSKFKNRGLVHDITTIWATDFLEKLILIKGEILACIFVCSGVPESYINKLTTQTNNPIITEDHVTGNILTIGQADLKNQIYAKWSRILNTSLKKKEVQRYKGKGNTLVDSLSRQISERYLMLLVSVVKNQINKRGKSNDKMLPSMLAAVGLNQEQFMKYIVELDPALHSAMLEIIKRNFDKIDNKFLDFNICIPSVNKDEIMFNFSLTQKDFLNNHSIRNKIEKFSKKISNNEEYVEPAGQEIDFIRVVNEERRKELEFLGILNIFFGFSRGNPYLITENIPTKEIAILIKEMKRANDYLSEDSVVFNRNIVRISEILTDSLHVESLKTITKSAKHIKFISDLPIDWIHINNVPLRNLVSMSRIPITPFNGLIHHCVVQNLYAIKKKGLSILLLNTLDKNNLVDAPLYNCAKGIHRFIEDFFSKHDLANAYQYFEAGNKLDFIDVLNQRDRNILIYFGHGSFDSKTEMGYLHIGKQDAISSLELAGMLTNVPEIVILGACETQVNWGTSVDVANSFINAGAVSVIGTYFEVDGAYTQLFILQILYNLHQACTSLGEVYWSDIIYACIKQRYLVDTFEFMTMKNRNIIDEYRSYCKQNGWEDIDINFHENVLKFLESKGSEFAITYRKRLSGNKNVYRSLLYVSLGSPEMIVFE